MGVDGRQTLYICGPESIIQKIEKLRGRITDCSEPTITATFEKEILEISERFFGTNAEIVHRSDRYIIFSYEYRNFPIHQYFDKLLETFPSCWIKNKYHNELGHCGIWIGRYVGGVKEIQDVFWKELSIDEEFHYGK
jgi:hypothetical protein